MAQWLGERLPALATNACPPFALSGQHGEGSELLDPSGLSETRKLPQ